LFHDPATLLVLRFALALLFATACVHKLRQFGEFRDTVADYELVPPALVTPAALLVIAIELFVVAALLVSAWVPAGSIVAAAVLSVYAAAIGINLARGRDSIDCGCSGAALRQPISGWLVLRNLLLAGAAWWAGAAVAERALGPWDYALTLVALCALLSLYLATEQLLANAPRSRRLSSAYD